MDSTTTTTTSLNDQAVEAPLTGLAFTFRALRSRNYRLFFFGQGVSLIGSWLTTTATSWLVFRLAQSSGVIDAAAALGVVRFAGQIPLFVLAPLAGVLVDRWDRHKVLVVAQVLAMLQSAALAYLALAHRITIPQVLWLNVFQGIVNAFDAPARQSFVVEMVSRRDDLPNAIALNSTLFNLARLLGPAIAGVLIAGFGEGMCFAIDAVSYFAVIVALLMMTVPARMVRENHKHPLRELKEGFLYAFGFAPSRFLLLLAGLVSLAVSAYQTLLPLFTEILAPHATMEHQAKLFGVLGTSIGIGALAGAIYLASRRSVVGLGRVIAIASVLLGMSMIAFGAARTMWLAVPLAAIGGLGMIISFAAGNTVLQAIISDEMRGRVMSFYIMAVMGTAPLGSILAGALAAKVGAPRTVMLSGAVSVAAAILFAMQLKRIRAIVRPIYRQKGIIPEMAKGIADANRLTTAAEE
jgi:MFS family permease